MTDDSNVNGDYASIYRAVGQLLSNDAEEPVAYGEAVSIDDTDTFKKMLRELVGPNPEPTNEIERHKPLDFPSHDIDTIVTSDELAGLLRRTEQTFVSLANTEPHWAVITNDRFRADRIEESKGQFYDSGEHNMRQIDWLLDRAGVDRTELKVCFELGSGVGRVTLWLAEQFERVIASDVSGRMLELADEYISAKGFDNVSYVELNKFQQFDTLEPFDFFYSSIVLQHNTPPVQRHMLSKIFAKLNAGGIAIFQVISAVNHYRFDASDYLADVVDGPRIEMHPFPQHELFAVAAEQGCRLLEIREEGSCGPTPEMVSNIVMLQKTSAAGKTDQRKHS